MAIIRARYTAAWLIGRTIRVLSRIRASLDSERATAAGSSARAPVSGIVITTFEARQFAYCLPLVEAIRAADAASPVVVVINGNPGSRVNLAERARFVAELSKFHGVFPVSLREMTGLARMWNLGIQVAACDTCVVLNDDLIAEPRLLLPDLRRLVGQAAQSGVAIGNGSWSHFAITRQCIESVGWFDERLLGFGEEDGDYSWRYRRLRGAYPPSVRLDGLANVVSPIRQDLARGSGKYSLANPVFISLKYRFLPGQVGIELEPPPEAKLPDMADYPGELFRWGLAGLLEVEDRETVRMHLEGRLGRLGTIEVDGETIDV